MNTRTLLIAAALAGAVLAAPVATAGAAPARTPLARFVLKLSDVPAGFELTKSGVPTHTAGTPAQESNYRKNHLGSWESVFTSTGAALKTTMIESDVSLYRTTASAHASFVLGLASLAKAHGVRVSLGASALGNESALLRLDRPNSVRVFILVWRRGPFVEDVITGALRGVSDPSLAVKLAPRQDRLLPRLFK